MPVFDCEADSLHPTKFHVLSYQTEDSPASITQQPSMRDWLEDQTLLIGHNIILWDLPNLERVLGAKPKAKVIDTLALSWYLYPERKMHGLDWWGRELGVEKPKIDDWKNQTLEEYTHRCQEDVLINTLLWNKMRTYLGLLYGTNDVENLPIISYLMFKMSCAREQERSRWKLDIPWCQDALTRLEKEQAPRIEALKLAMPMVKKMVLKEPPAKPYKKDGTLSVEGAKWQKYLSDQGLTKTHSSPIYILSKEEEPNPNSPEQVKNWLFSLGWEPITFKFVKEDDGTERKIPQIKLPDSPDICPSVLELSEDHPAIRELEGLSVVKHRLGILQGFLNNVDEEGFLKARVQGFTNTLRFKHSTIVNLPGVHKPYGEDIRGCLVSREGYELCGSDMVALENKTGDHYIYNLDPKFVLAKDVPEYDSHTEMCVIAGLITEEEEKFYKWYKKKP